MENYNGRIFRNSDTARMIELRLSGLSYSEIFKLHGYHHTSVKLSMKKYYGVNSGNKMITLQSGI